LGKLQNLTWLQWLLSIALLLPVIAILCGALGFIGGTRAHDNALQQAIANDLQTQFALGSADLETGNYDIARQRFEYIIRQEPEFPGAMEALTQALIAVESKPGQPTQQPVTTATITLTPTPDTRPLDELFATAQSQLQNQDWQNLAQTVISIRNSDPQYQVVKLDRMLFLALRMGGIQKIINDGNLGGGTYDLALAEKFAPLDTEANMYRSWAHLYQVGVSFWGVYPDKSIYYFSQLAPAAPYLRDSSGIYANERYRLAIIQYGDQFARDGDWCSAVEQYDMAQSLGDDVSLQPTAVYAVEQCSSPDEDTEASDGEQTATPTAPIPLATTPAAPLVTVTPTVPQTAVATATPTQGSTATQAVVPTNTTQPTATLASTATVSPPAPTTEVAE
jgi:hypothetical protein